MAHYSKGQRPSELWAWAQGEAQALRAMIPAGQYPVLVYRGMSGVATATALMLAWNTADFGLIGMIYVRKEHENSHGSEIEADSMDNERKGVLCFVDDFVASGNTERQAMRKALSRMDRDWNLDLDYFIRVESGDRGSYRGAGRSRQGMPPEWLPYWAQPQPEPQPAQSTTALEALDVSRYLDARPAAKRAAEYAYAYGLSPARASVGLDYG